MHSGKNWITSDSIKFKILIFPRRKRDVKTWIAEEDEDNNTDTWTAFKGGIANWLQNRKSSNRSTSSLGTIKDEDKQV